MVKVPEPDPGGHFGPYGGRYVPEVLMAPLEELETVYREARRDPAFQSELEGLLVSYAGRPTPLYYARRLSESLGGARLYIKREDLLHTGAHKINNCLGQVLLARRMGKRRVVAETGAGQHGVATATVCALFGFECVVYMGEEDMCRQRLNVFRMRLLGARVVGVSSGSRTLKDAINEAMRDWCDQRRNHALPARFRAWRPPVPGHGARFPERDRARSPRTDPAGRGDGFRMRCSPASAAGSNAIGIFYAFVPDAEVRLIGVEAGGRGTLPGEHAARFAGGSPGVLQGAFSYLLQDDDGQVSLTHSVSAGLDYAMIGPEHAWLHDLERAEYCSASDTEALDAARLLSRTEGLIPALESAHGAAEAIRRAPAAKGQVFIVNLSGRGDKDIDIYREHFPELDADEAKGGQK